MHILKKSGAANIIKLKKNLQGYIREEELATYFQIINTITLHKL